jgi:hypothetical protein
MAAYAASARISAVRPYRTSRRELSAVAISVSEVADLPLERAAPEFDGREPDRRSWADIVISWTETTFYLFDPESWR